MTEERLIRILAASYFWPGAEYDDVAQEARYALERARKLWSPDKGCEWPRFAWMCVKAHLIEQVRRETQRRPQFACLDDTHEAPANLVDLVEARETLRRVVSTSLTDKERIALGRRIRGEPTSEPKWMDNALQRARAKVAA